MPDVEKLEEEAEKKGLHGQEEKRYVGGVFNKIRQAHKKASPEKKKAAKERVKKMVENHSKQPTEEEREKKRTEILTAEVAESLGYRPYGKYMVRKVGGKYRIFHRIEDQPYVSGVGDFNTEQAAIKYISNKLM